MRKDNDLHREAEDLHREAEDLHREAEDLQEPAKMLSYDKITVVIFLVAIFFFLWAIEDLTNDYLVDLIIK